VRLVVDASVAIKWLIDEPDSELADRLLDGAHDFMAPELIIPEVLSAAWKRRRLGEIADAQFDGIVIRILDGLISCRSLQSLALRAAAIARELDHPVYDCFYLALAEAEEAPLVTSDRRLVAVVRGTPWARRVSQLRSLTDRSSRRR
jgi:predicted nucleic acid-binding protein